MSASIESEGSAADLHETVTDHIFRAGLTLAAIPGLPGVSVDVAARVRDVLDALDTAIAELRTAAFARFVAAGDQHGEPTTAPALDGGRRLCHFSVDEVFAYAVNARDFYRAGDHQLWAHESRGLLLSARSGTPLARRDGRVFYDVETNAPLYYESGNLELPAVALGERE